MTWICFRCNERGTSFRFVREHLRLDDRETARVLAGESYAQGTAYDEVKFKTSLGVGPAGPQAVAARKPSLLPDEYRLLPCDSVIGRAASAYLSGRGVTAEQVATHRIGFASRGRYAGCLILPVVQSGLLAYYVARTFLHPGKRYINPANGTTVLSVSEVLFNIDVATLFGSVTLVEGYFDALAEGQTGVAMFGKVLSPSQIALLVAARGRVKSVRVKLDGDQDLAVSMAIARQLSDAGFEDVSCDVPVGDPADRLGLRSSTAYAFATYVAAKVGGLR